VPSLPPGKLATLEAIILKKPNRFKSPLPSAVNLIEKDELLESRINEILLKYPQHKRVLFIQAKLKNNEAIATLEKSEIERFHKLLMK
jgi:hypothetical protein